MKNSPGTLRASIVRACSPFVSTPPAVTSAFSNPSVPAGWKAHLRRFLSHASSAAIRPALRRARFGQMICQPLRQSRPQHLAQGRRIPPRPGLHQWSQYTASPACQAKNPSTAARRDSSSSRPATPPARLGRDVLPASSLETSHRSREPPLPPQRRPTPSSPPRHHPAPGAPAPAGASRLSAQTAAPIRTPAQSHPASESTGRP